MGRMMRLAPRLFAGLGGLLLLAGCGSYATPYAGTPAAAREALVGTTIPDLAFGGEAHAEPARATGEGVVWQIDKGSIDTAASHPSLLLLPRVARRRSATEG